uniref:tetraacyldisaccharide 4'-kinase n=1 Tax=Globisporangium ultimum (strain ATCC 200006 / CBS 805.95 / DAOM BR144) TaxID=431595 RepID=K3WFD6_GLOUD
MVLLMRAWRRMRRQCHAAVLSALRSRKSSAPAAIEARGDGSSEQNKRWLSALYGAIIATKRTRELARAARISPPAVPVISVGNVTFGATGKTPCVLFLTDMILHHSFHTTAKVPMLLSRGYGDDEWRLFASLFPECKVAIGSDRVRIGAQAVQDFNDALSCILLDDGLQQWRIRKDLEIVMIDALHPFGNGALIPHGSLRETPQDALARADIVILHHANLLPTQTALDTLRSEIHAYSSTKGGHTVIATSQMNVQGLVPVGEIGSVKPDTSFSSNYDELKGKCAFILCGVGNPDSVKRVVDSMGCWHHVHMEAFPDHYMFTQADLEDMQQEVVALAQRTQRDVVVVTTEKDFFRDEQLLTTFANQCDVRVLRCAFELADNAHVVQQRVLEVLASK